MLSGDLCCDETSRSCKQSESTWCFRHAVLKYASNQLASAPVGLQAELAQAVDTVGTSAFFDMRACTAGRTLRASSHLLLRTHVRNTSQERASSG